MRHGFWLAMFALLSVCGCRPAEVGPEAVTVAPASPVETPSPAPLPAESETPAGFVASVFDLPEGEITVTEKKPPDLNRSSLGISYVWSYGLGTAYLCSHGTKEFRVDTPGPGIWSAVNVARMNHPGKGELSETRVRAIADAVVKRRWSDRAAEMEWVLGGRRQGDTYNLKYQIKVAPDILTGDEATVVVAPDGGLVAYGEQRAQRQVRPEDIIITGEEAIARAWTYIDPPADMKPRLRASQPILTLSSPLHPDWGPVWAVFIRASGLQPLWTDGWTMSNGVLVDAMTGEKIPPPAVDWP